MLRQPAPIHIHVQLRLAGTSLCRRCLEAGKILSAPNSPYHAFEVDGQCSYDIKYRKVCLFALLWLLYPPALLLNKGKIQIPPEAALPNATAGGIFSPLFFSACNINPVTSITFILLLILFIVSINKGKEPINELKPNNDANIKSASKATVNNEVSNKSNDKDKDETITRQDNNDSSVDIKNENDVIHYFENNYNDINSNKVSIKDKAKEYFIDIVDFIFYDKEIIEDMVLVAVNSAIEKMEADKADKFGKYGQMFNGLM